MKIKTLMAAFCVLAATSGVADALEVGETWIMAPPPGVTIAAAYINIEGGPQVDRLLSVSCACAARAELHEMSMSGAVMTMRPLPDGAAVPLTGLHMQPHGVHVMLTGLTRALREGDRVDLTLTFASAGTVGASAVVRRR